MKRLGLTWPDLASPEATAASWRSWLGRAWQVPELTAAVEAASPDLARQVTRIVSAGDSPDALVRRTALSVLRYLLRGTSRATPFGLLAGVAPAASGPAPASGRGPRTGRRHGPMRPGSQDPKQPTGTSCAANGQSGFAAYRRAGDAYVLHTLQVFTATVDGIGRKSVFQDAEVFASFGPADSLTP